MTTIIVPPQYKDRVATVIDDVDYELLEVVVRQFPNNEVLARIPEIEMADDKILLFFPLFPQVNDNFMLLLQTLEVIRYYKTNSKLMLIIPYLSYSRQDKRFLVGESLSLKVILDAISLYRPTYLVIYDVHNIQAVVELSDIPLIHLSIYQEILAKALNILSINSKNILLLSPDKGREFVVKNLSKRFGCSYAVVSKFRDRNTGEVSFSFSKMDLSLKDFDAVFIIDDEISTGGTMAGVAKYVTENGNPNVYALATHLLLVNNAEQRLFDSGVKNIFGSDTVMRSFSIFSIFETFPKLMEFLK